MNTQFLNLFSRSHKCVSNCKTGRDGPPLLFRKVLAKVIKNGYKVEKKVPIVWEWKTFRKLYLSSHCTCGVGTHQRRDRLFHDVSPKAFFWGKIHLVQHVLHSCLACAQCQRARKVVIPITPLLTQNPRDLVSILQFLAESILSSRNNTLTFVLYSLLWISRSGRKTKFRRVTLCGC